MNRMKDLSDLRIDTANKAYRDYIASAEIPKSVKLEEAAERTDNFVLRESIRRQTDTNFPQKILRERIIGPTNDIKDQPPFELARKRGIPVARLYEIAPGVQPSGFGTGFLIAQNLLITNHHVFPSAAYAENCGANFLHERDLAGRILEGSAYRLRPDIFFYNYEDLDYAIVYVEDSPLFGTNLLSTLGCLPLISTLGKVIKGSPINIIEYPLGEYKKYAYENNTVTDTDDEKGIIQYTTDTQPAASGSPAFNNAWEVVALHYTGIPFQVNGQWMTKKGEVWNKSMPEDDINWIANAGKSISKIVTHLKSLNPGDASMKYIESILKNTGDPLLKAPLLTNESGALQNPLSLNGLNNTTMGNIVINFTGSNNIYINTAGGAAGVQPVVTAVSTVTSGPAATEEKKLRFDENYNTRKGYNENFLSGFKVPLPFVEHRKNELYTALGETEPFELKYHNYSLVMNKKRRFLMWSAGNVNYSSDFRDDRDRADFGDDSSAWRVDPRIPEKFQVQGPDFYDPATLVDKGHIVRRDDNCWGKTALQIEYGNSDSFHYTNCTPQHEQFNRDMFGVHGLWGVLENAIKTQLDTVSDPNRDYHQKACVLAGPVLDNQNDPSYNEIKYPLKFWKVFVIVSDSEGPLVYGFILSQNDVVTRLGLEKEALPHFTNQVKAMQASLEEITHISGVSFKPELHAHDVKAGSGPANESLRQDMSNFKTRKDNR